MSTITHLCYLMVSKSSSKVYALIDYIVAGYVYGEQALHGQASQNDGQVICPRTKDVYSFKEAEKIYIM